MSGDSSTPPDEGDEHRLSWRDRELLSALRRLANSRAQVQSLEAELKSQSSVAPPDPADVRQVETIEGVAPANGPLHPIQSALARHHGLQCGYCTPGVVMTLIELAREYTDRSPTEAEVRRALAGNLCRCTGYQGMVDAALAVLGPGARGEAM